MKPWLKRPALTTALTLTSIGYALLLWQGPWWIDGDHLRSSDLQPADGVVITGVRTALVALGAGAIAALGLYYTHRTLEHTRHRDAETLEQTRKRDAEQEKAATEGQINQRYVDAVKLLASNDSLTQRLGGIYALERNMHESERDHPTVLAILSAFVRASAPSATISTSGGSTVGRPAQDVQAALDVIGRRPPRSPSPLVNLSGTDLNGADFRGTDLRGVNLTDTHLRGSNLQAADLRGTDLRGANLAGAHLRNARLQEADLSGADLRSADLRLANLSNANLTDANLRDADLEAAQLVEASLMKADLTGARFRESNLSDAYLRGANLSSAHLPGASLTGAQLDGANLTNADLPSTDLTDARLDGPAQICSARLYATTKLPEYLHASPLVQERIQERARRKFKPGETPGPPAPA
ncbi:pentapeptide repeat-containing protein [Streptomyces sp. NBC_01465]|uniref:pentapeptide repeat-containing protein n=1 Tax=Streptomyces sp. NBC_01465 TaxID=2903878 RepID=UPI002E2EDF6B|nr:pentapeptide repeat-containing protein [Streptomyces sp. NBC_01465]